MKPNLSKTTHQDTFKDILQRLAAPMPYKWRIQSINDFKCICVAYIDARQVMERLDSVMGSNWQRDHKLIGDKVYCGVALYDGVQWLWRWDCGVESKTEAEKGEASDSFKRAAVNWGVGRFLYDLPIQSLNVSQYKGKNYPADNLGGCLFNSEQLNNYLEQIVPQQAKSSDEWSPLDDELDSILNND